MKRALLVLAGVALVLGVVLIWRADRGAPSPANERKAAPVPRPPSLRAPRSTPRSTMDAALIDAGEKEPAALMRDGDSVIAGRLTRGGSATEGQVAAALAGGPPETRSVHRVGVGGDGEYRLTKLPAGRYDVSAAPVPLGTEVHSSWGESTIVVESGKTVFADFEFPASLVAVVNVDPGNHPTEAVSHFIVRGELAGSKPSAENTFVAFGGVAIDKPIIQRDLEPGLYTVCVSAERTETPATACLPFELRASPAEQVFTVRLP